MSSKKAELLAISCNILPQTERIPDIRRYRGQIGYFGAETVKDVPHSQHPKWTVSAADSTSAALDSSE